MHELLAPPPVSAVPSDPATAHPSSQPPGDSLPTPAMDRFQEEEMQRRQLLLLMAAAPAAALAAPASDVLEGVRQSMDAVLEGSAVGPATIERWERTAREYALAYQSVPPRELLAEVVADCGELKQLLSLSLPVRTRARLCRVGGQLAALTGIFSSAMGEHRRARAWFHTTRLAADEAQDPQLAALALVRSAIVALYYGAPSSALEQAEQARMIVGPAPTPWLARGLVVEARALARLGDTGQARQRLDAAHATFDRLTKDQVGDPAFGYTERQFWFTVGNAYTHLGRNGEAEDAHRRARALYPVTEYLDPTLMEIDRATRVANGGDPVEAVGHVVDAVSALPDGHQGGLVTHYAQSFLAQLPITVRAGAPARELRQLIGHGPGA